MSSGCFSKNRSNQPSKIKAAALLLFILLYILAPLYGAKAQTGDCAGYECVDTSEFSDDAIADGWSASNFGTEIGWTEQKTLGGIWQSSSAEGVMTAAYQHPSPDDFSSVTKVSKPVLIQPGRYRVIWRVGIEKDALDFRQHDQGVLITHSTGGDLGLGRYSISGNFATYQSAWFIIDQPGTIKIEITVDNSENLWTTPTVAYFDYIWLIEDATATATPAAGTPTATTLPAQSTPIPSATPYCIAPPATPTPTPDIPGFSLTPSPTPSPTPTPDPITGWAFLDEVSGFDMNPMWSTTGVYPNAPRFSLSHGRVHNNQPISSLFIPFSSDPDLEDRATLIFVTPYTLTTNLYVDGWAQTDAVPVSTSAYMEIWILESGGSWASFTTVQVSAQNWYPFHIVITPPAGGTAAIAFVSSRTDTPSTSTAGVYLDDIYLYADSVNAPRCDGTYAIPRSTPPGVTVPIEVPVGKKCPADLIVPNNFWGPLLAELTLFLDRLFAFSPDHQPHSLTDAVSNLIVSPVGTFFGLAITMFDLRIYLGVFGFMLLLNAVGIPVAIWQMIKQNIPFL